MHYPASKERLIRIASHLFVRYGGISESRVDTLIRNAFSPEIIDDPTLASDHIRIGLVELGLLSRNAGTQRYSINLERFLSPDNIRILLGDDFPIQNIKSANHLAKKIRTRAIRDGVLVADG